MKQTATVDLSKHDMNTDYSRIRLKRAKAIRVKCLDCTCNQIAEITNCDIKSCPLWRYRTGREEKDNLNPFYSNSS